MNLDGCAALVSGGASGLGAATARALHEAGAIVTILDRDAGLGNAVAKAISGVFVRADVTDQEAVAAGVCVAVDTGLPLRVVVNCAGIGGGQRLVGRGAIPHDPAVFRKVVEVNLFGTFHLMRLGGAAISQTEPLADGERGVIINTASAAAFDGQVGQTAYAASKGAIVAMTLPAARDLAPVGIRVCTIAPGIFDTPLARAVNEQTQHGLLSDLIFPKRRGHAEEYALLVRSIVENPYLNGEVIRLDGAVRLPPR